MLHPTPWRFRFAFPDRPGHLARASAALAELGVNILDLDVHVVDDRAVADDLLLSVPAWVDPPAVEAALTAAGATEVRGVPVDAHELVDGESRALHLAARAVVAGADPDELAGALGDLVDASAVVLREVPGMALAPIARRALAEAAPVRGREHVLRVRGADGAGACVAAVPVGDGRVAVLARPAPAFSYTELARVRALLQLHAVAGAAGAWGARTVVGVLADGAEVDVSPLGRADLAAVVALHERCSPRTRALRYLGGATTAPVEVVAGQLRPAPGRTVLGASLDGELVGMASADPAGGREAELAVLVADAHQRRGIGTLLVRRLVAAAACAGFDDVVAVTRPDNVGLLRLLRRAGLAPVATLDDGLLRLTSPTRALPRRPGARRGEGPSGLS